MTLQPSGMALVHVGRCDLLEQTFLQCDSLLPPPPPPCPCPPPLLLLLCRPKHTNSASGASSPVEAPPLHPAPSISRLWGDVLTGPGSSALTNDWHHQAPIHSAPFCMDDGSAAFLETVNEQLEKGWRVRDSVCLWSLN